MGQKVNPQVIRLGILYTWSSRWFEAKRYKEVLLEDYVLRKKLMDRLRPAGVARVEIERSINSVKIIAFVSRPGLVIGRAGTGLEELKKYINEHMNKIKKTKHLPKIDIRIEAVKEPNLDAYLVARNIADMLIRRMPYKRIMGQSVDRAMNAGALGIQVLLSGRIAGAEIHRREKLKQGTIPLSTIRERVNYASVPALTKKGYIGVKVWINKPANKE